MEIPGWIAEHWFELVSTASIAGGLLTNAHAIYEEARERKISNLFAITAAHRALWTNFSERPELHRVLETEVNLEKNPVTLAEGRFVHDLILHLRASFKARQLKMQFDDDAIAADIKQFFARPIPRSVWEKSKRYQDRDFVEFVETSMGDSL